MKVFLIYGFLCSGIIVSTYGDDHLLNGCTAENLQNGLDYCLMEIEDTIVTEEWFQDTLDTGEKPSFDIYINVTYNVDNYDIKVCDDTTTIMKTATVVVPGDTVGPAYSKLMPAVTLHNQTGTSLDGKYYTFLMIDVGEEDSNCGTPSHPVVYWMKNNILSGDFSTGQDILKYVTVAPRDMDVHKLVFLLFEQEDGKAATINPADYTPSEISCPLLAFDAFDHTSRALFDLASFAQDKSLKLVSAAWHYSKVDEYAVDFWLEYGDDVGLKDAEKPIICCWINICCWEELGEGMFERCETSGAPSCYSMSAISAAAASTSAFLLK